MRLIIVLLLSCLKLLALDQSDIDLIDEFGIVSSKVKMHDGDWGINLKNFDKDDSTYGPDQFRDLNDWKNIQVDKWFDLETWIKNREVKDSLPDWRVHLRNKLNAELVGRVIKCIGVCKYFHRLEPITASSQTVLREGDEFVTQENSAAWLSLIDGTLLRVSAKTSFSLTEVNLSQKDIFYLIRLNYGHMQVISRRKGEFEQINKPETDLAFYPLWIKEANREYYGIQEYRQYDEQEKLIYSATENPGYVSQIKHLNHLLNTEHENSFSKKIHLYIYTPLYSIKSEGMHLNLFYEINGTGDFKVTKNLSHFKDTDQRIQKAEVILRGYKEFNKFEPDSDAWYQVSSNGNEYKNDPNLFARYGVTEGFVDRIFTLHLAREYMLKTYSLKLIQSELDEFELTRSFGYRLWDSEKELSKRISFLDEYIRRIETTNITAIQKVFRDKKENIFNYEYYAYVMKQHYFAIRSMYAERNRSVVEMTDAQYYLWILRNGRK